MAEIERKTKHYPTDLTDEEWARSSLSWPKPSATGRRLEVLREAMNAIRYVARTGCGWRMLPRDFPPWQTVYWWFRRFVRRMLFRTIHNIAVMMDRERAGREASPTAGILDSQTVKAPAPGATRGYDGAKKTVGRKRHIAVDTDGRLLMVNLTAADISDSAGAQEVLKALHQRWPWLTHLFADSAYDRGTLMDKAAFSRLHRRGDPANRQAARFQGHAPTMGGRAHLRLAHPVARLARDYEARIDVSEAMNHIALGSILLRRISH